MYRDMKIIPLLDSVTDLYYVLQQPSTAWLGPPFSRSQQILAWSAILYLFLFPHWGHYHLKLYYPIGNTAQLFFILSHVASSLISPWWDPKKLADSWWSTHPTATFYLSFFSFCLIWNGSTKPSLQAVSNKTTDSRFMG